MLPIIEEICQICLERPENAIVASCNPWLYCRHAILSLKWEKPSKFSVKEQALRYEFPADICLIPLGKIGAITGQNSILHEQSQIIGKN